MKIQVDYREEDLARLIQAAPTDLENELKSAIVAAMAGRSLDDLDAVFWEWSQHWPVITVLDGQIVLTGETTEGGAEEINYDNRAMISISDARSAGWVVDEEYAYPPDTA